MQYIMQPHWFLNPYNVANWPDLSNFRSTTGNFYVADFGAPTIAFVFHRQNVLIEKTRLTAINLHAVNNSGLIFICNEPVAYYCGSPTNYVNTFYIPNNTSNARVFEFDTIDKFLVTNGIDRCTVYTCDYNVPAEILLRYNRIVVVTFDYFLYLKMEEMQEIVCLDTTATVTYKIACLNGHLSCHRGRTIQMLDATTSAVSWRDSSSKIEQPMLAVSDNQLISMQHTNRYNNNLFAALDYYSRSAVALVNETRFFQPSAYISEKVFYAMLYKKPVLLASSPRSLEYLRKLGFKTWGALWDESYDLIEDHEARLQTIKDIIDYIQSKTVDELIEMSASIQDILDHNYNRIQEIKANPMLLKLEN